MWWIDLAVAVGFVIGVGVKQLIDLRNERARQSAEVVRAQEHRRPNRPGS